VSAPADDAIPGIAVSTFVVQVCEQEELVSSEEYVRTVFTDAIAEHLALRQKNAPLEPHMPLRDYLPKDYVRLVETPTVEVRSPTRQWFDLDDGSALDWAA
jgi:hypothetical protein